MTVRQKLDVRGLEAVTELVTSTAKKFGQID